MRPGVRGIVFVLTLTAAVLQSVSFAAFQVRGRVGTPAPVPSNIDAFVAGAQVVVHGRVTGSELTFLPPPHEQEDPLVIRKHKVQVLETLKGESLVKGRSVITVTQLGGTLDIQGREVSTPYDTPTKLLEKGEEVVLTLIEWPRAESFAIRWGAAGIFLVKDGKVKARAEALRIPEFKQGRAIELRELLVALKQSHLSIPRQ